MYFLLLIASLFVFVSCGADYDASAASKLERSTTLESSREPLVAASSDKRQEKRYAPYSGVTGYGGYGGYGGDINSYLGYQSGYYSPYNSRSLSGIDSYSGVYPNSGYGGYGAYGLNPHNYNSYYNPRFGSYPYQRYNSYPSSYYSSNYANSIVGGGFGATGAVSPILGTGYQYAIGTGY